MPPPDVANQPSTQRDPNRTRTFIQTPSPNESHSQNPFSISIHRTTAHLLIQTYSSSLPIFLPHAPCQHFAYFKVFPWPPLSQSAQRNLWSNLPCLGSIGPSDTRARDICCSLLPERSPHAPHQTTCFLINFCLLFRSWLMSLPQESSL